MKKIFVLLLACILVFSIMVSISACKPKNPDDNDGPGTDNSGDTPSGDQTDDNIPDGNNGINLPVIPINPTTPETGDNTDGENENTEG